MIAKVATTQWSQVLAARDGSETEARQALEALCQTYWQSLYAYIRHQGSDPEEARDLVQAYFTELLDKDFLASVDPSKGRFRTFLLVSLRHFLSHERGKARAMKRGGRTFTVSLDVEAGEGRYGIQPVEKKTPEDVFERRWAMTVLDRAMERLQHLAEDSGNQVQFEQLSQYLTSEGTQMPYRTAAVALGISEGGVKAAVHRLRKRFGQCLRAEIAETVADPSEVDDEVRYLLGVIRA